MTGQLSPIVQCSCCQAIADLNEDPHAWDSWSFKETPRCPHCNGQDRVIEAKAQKAASNLALMATV